MALGDSMLGKRRIRKRYKTLDGFPAQENGSLFSYEFCIYFNHI